MTVTVLNVNKGEDRTSLAGELRIIADMLEAKESPVICVALSYEVESEEHSNNVEQVSIAPNRYWLKGMLYDFAEAI